MDRHQAGRFAAGAQCQPSRKCGSKFTWCVPNFTRMSDRDFHCTNCRLTSSASYRQLCFTCSDCVARPFHVSFPEAPNQKALGDSLRDNEENDWKEVKANVPLILPWKELLGNFAHSSMGKIRVHQRVLEKTQKGLAFVLFQFSFGHRT